MLVVAGHFAWFVYVWFRQSSREDCVSHGGASTPGHNNSSSQNYETTFDVDGNVETVSTSSLGNKEETRSQRSVGSSRDGNRWVQVGVTKW